MWQDPKIVPVLQDRALKTGPARNESGLPVMFCCGAAPQVGDGFAHLSAGMSIVELVVIVSMPIMMLAIMVYI
jgi:hypothetical protein